ncbi:hypothetical protein PRNP1_004305 [Phytophthora ramorum]
METHAPLQRHPKCSALYATFRHESAAAKSVEPNVAYLANVTVEVTTKTLTRGASTFALTVHDRKSSSTWRHLRSYADCRAFQSRVLQVLSRGHLCFAECPWLFAYVQRALPAERTGHHLFRVAGHGPKPRVVEKQRQALARLVATLQRVLLNPLNQKCSVLLRQVAPEVMTFITNRSDGDGHEALHSPSSDRPLAKTFSESFMFAVDESEKSAQSSTTTVAEEVDEQVAVQTVDKVVAGQRVCCAMCALHKMRSDEQVFACWRAETMSSRLMRLRAGAGAERTSLVAKRQSSTHSASTHAKSAWASPSYSQRETSPLEPLAVLGGRDSEVPAMVATDHDGTPTAPFPGSPGTPRGSIASSSGASSVCEIDLELLDTWRLSTAEKTSQPLGGSGGANFRRLPRCSLFVLNSIRSKFATSKQRGGVRI